MMQKIKNRIKIRIVILIALAFIAGMSISFSKWYVPVALKAFAGRMGVPSWALWDTCYPDPMFYLRYYQYEYYIYSLATP